MTEKILIIDDDDNVLSGLKRQFRGHFNLSTAKGGDKAFALVNSAGPFAVAVCDMRMPGKDGIEVLGELKKLTPDTVRMMLTGNADQQTAIDAINKGDIFRFFTKPCPPDQLAEGIEAALAQFRLVTAERDLLQKTLAGSVKVLVDVLSMIDPSAFGKATALCEWARDLALHIRLPKRWQLDMAVMLSRIGSVAIPAEIQAKLKSGQDLTPMEQAMVREVPETGRKWIGNIPRLKLVAEIVYYQDKGFDGSGFPEDTLSGEDIPLGARILKVLNDLAAVSPDTSPGEGAFKLLAGQAKKYDPAILRAARECLVREDNAPGRKEHQDVAEIPVSLLMAGYRLLSNIEAEDGQLILAKNQVISDAQLTKIRNLSKVRGIKEPIRILKRVVSQA